MQATEVLTQEHKILRPFVDALEVVARKLEASDPVRPQLFTDIADFINSFVDGCHHRKEEGALFPALEAAGVPQLGGLMGEILAEHDESRRLTREMQYGADRLASGNKGAAFALALTTLSYVRLVRAHTAKEDNALFPMADKTLSQRQQEDLAVEFDRIEREEVGGAGHELFVRMARDLEIEARGA